MLPHKHAILSTSIGAAAWAASGDPALLGMAFVCGVMPDVDHIVDYAYLARFEGHRLILPLHGYEYVILGSAIALMSGSTLFTVATLSYLMHLLADQLENRTRLPGYSLLFRAWHSFRIEAISTAPEAAIRGREDDVRRLQKLWLRSMRRIERV